MMRATTRRRLGGKAGFELATAATAGSKCRPLFAKMPGPGLVES